MANFLNTDGLSALWAKIKSKFYTKTEVDALISEPEIFIVNITYDSENDKNTADKSKLEVDNALNAGKIIMGLYDGEYYEYDGFYFYHNNPFSGHPYSSVYSYIENSNINELEFHSFSFVSQDDLTVFQSNYLSKFNTTSYTPTANYHPATKKYVDDSIPAPEIMIVNIIIDNGDYVADKTQTEVATAYAAGKIIYALYGTPNKSAYFYDGLNGDGNAYFWTDGYFDEYGNYCVPYFYYTNTGNTYLLTHGENEISISNTLTKTNTTSYTPTGDYNPATKKYVDDSIPENELFIVTLTVNGNTYTADKTTAQINEAVTNNKHCIAIQHNSNGITNIYNYVFGTSTYAYFSKGNRLFDGYFNVETIQYDRNGIIQTIQQLPTDLIHMSDTTISSPTEGQVLQYDATNEVWKNANLTDNIFLITATSAYNSSTGENDYSVDKTYNEIVEARNAGKICLVKWGSTYYYYKDEDNSTLLFVSFYKITHHNKYEIYNLTITSTNNVNAYNFEIPQEISDLNNVSASSPYSGQSLIYNSTNQRWQNGYIPLTNLSDTTISSPTNGQVLSYDSTTSKWINTNALTETRVNELIAVALAQYGDGDTASYGYTDASEVNY